MKKWNHDKGSSGEDKARRLLEKEGYELLTANYRCKFGEIDLIMKDGDWLVFVEVKMKTGDRFGRPAEMIDLKKIWRIRKAAEWYLKTEGGSRLFSRYRIDAVCLSLFGDSVRLRHYKNIGI